jgi:predicted ABC-type ATPase
MSNKKPMLLVFAGPNGSGKSTIKQYFETVGEYTNADDVVAATGMSNEDAAAFVDKKRYSSIANNEDLTFETVLSSKYKLDILEKAKQEGYFIKCVFVLTVDPPN